MADTAIDTSAGFGLGYDFRPQPDVMASEPAAAPQQAPTQAPTALQTGVQPPTPQEDDHDADMSAWSTDWNKALGTVRSHYGDYRELFKDVPKAEQLASEDPRWANYNNALQLSRQLDPKSQKTVIPHMERLKAQIHADAVRKHNELRNEITAQYKAHSEKAEQGEGGQSFNQRSMNIATATTTELDRIKKLAETADPEAKKLAMEASLIAAPTLLGQRYNSVASNMALKSGLLDEDVPRLMNVLASPLPPGERGFNGYRGRAAANYKIAGVDVNGNYIVQLPGERVVRMPQNDLRAVELARQKGYDILRKHREEAAKRAKEPGVLEQGANWVKRQLE